MKKLLLEEAEFVAHHLASELFKEYNEPIPEFSSRYSGRLESCLETPFQTYDGQDLYGTGIAEKAGVLFYLVIKNHPFENGNKRMAVTLSLVFLFKNGYWLNARPEEMYNIALKVASSKPKDKEAQIHALSMTFAKFLKRLSLKDKIA